MQASQFTYFLAGLVLLVRALNGADYKYTPIADNAPSSQFTGGFTYFAINSKGVVAFTANQKNRAPGAFAGSGGTITTIVEESADFVSMQVTGINDAGTVVFLSQQGTAIYTGDGSNKPFLVAAKSADLELLAQAPAFPAINNSGTVAFNTLHTIRSRTGTGPIQTILSDTDLPRANVLVAPTITGVGINDAGTVSFLAQLVSGACQCGIFTKGQGSPVLLAESVSALRPPINDSGAIAFADRYQNRLGVFVASGGTVGTAIDLSSQSGVSLAPFTLGLNNKGQVAFGGTFRSSTISGIFTGSSQTKDKVIGTGDSLFGSTVASIGLFVNQNNILNDNGQVAFAYTLTNGLSGIAVATPVTTGAQAPSLPANGIVNAGSFSTTSVAAPGSIVSLFGSNFSSELVLPAGYPLPTSLNGVSVSFNGIAAPLYFVAPGQINAQVPFELTTATADIRINTPAGQSETRTIPIAQQSPSIFTISQTGAGQGVVVFGNTATLVAPITPGADWRPARAGDTITIYANGLGAVTPPVLSGSNSCDRSTCAPDLSNLTLRQTVVRPQVEIGGVVVPDSSILFSGLVPQYVGLYQINVTIPDGIRGGGQVPIVIHMGKNGSPLSVSIALQ